MCKIGISNNFESRIKTHKANNYHGIIPATNREGEILYFCFAIHNYKRIEALLKKVLSTIGRSEIYQISAIDAYELLYRLGGKEVFNNTHISIRDVSVSTGTNVDKLSYPKQMIYYAEQLIQTGRTIDLDKLTFVYSEDKYQKLSDSRKSRTKKLTNGNYAYTNYDANDSIKFIQQMISLLS